MNRRGFLSSILAAGVAPFVVRAESLMAVRVPASGLIVPAALSPLEIFEQYGKLYTFTKRDIVDYEHAFFRCVKDGFAMYRVEVGKLSRG